MRHKRTQTPIKMKDYKGLLSLICLLRLNFLRVNDIAIGSGVYSIDFFDAKDASGKEVERVCLKDEKNNEYQVSEKQLAALRIATGPVAAVWFDEFKADPNATTFQVKARELLAAGKDIRDVKFRAVKQLKVRNNQVTVLDTPVYRDNCYEGSAEYTRSTRALTSGKAAEFFSSPEYFRGMAEIREKLHSTTVKPGKAIDANLVYLPVFEIV